MGKAVWRHVVVGLVGTLCSATSAFAEVKNDLRADPFVFVGAAGDCGPAAGSNIVTAAWLGGMGLPDNGGDNSNALDPADNPNKRDPHLGLLLSKNGPFQDCSSSGARILGVRGTVVSATFELGFDYRNGGHCGAGAPRFNVVVQNSLTNTETFHFIGGCANDHTPTVAPQDPDEWTRVRFQTVDPTEAFPPIPPNSRIRTITLLYDEGTNVPSVQDPMGVGLAVVDNIFINGKFIRRGEGIAPNSKAVDDDDFDDDGRRDDGDDDDDNDGHNDRDDNDDDDDGYTDDRDSDDDNDGLGDRHDTRGQRESVTTNSVELAPGESAAFPLTPEAGSTTLIAELDDAALLITEVVDPNGIVVGTSIPGIGSVRIEVPVTSPGTYTVKVRNVSATPATATNTVVSRRSW